jgi:hypothetical protein
MASTWAGERSPGFALKFLSVSHATIGRSARGIARSRTCVGMPMVRYSRSSASALAAAASAAAMPARHTPKASAMRPALSTSSGGVRRVTVGITAEVASPCLT